MVIRRCKPQVERWDHQKVEQGRGNQSAQNNNSHGQFDLVAGNIAGPNQRHQGQPGSSGRHQDGRQALLGAPQDQLPPKGHTFLCFEVLEVVDHHDPVAGGNPQNGQEANYRTQRNDATAEVSRQNTSDQGHGQAQEGEHRQAGALERSMQKEEDAQQG